MPAPASKAEDMSPVIAAALAVDLRSAAEFADGHHQRLGQQATLVQILDQRGEADVELRAEHVLQAVGVLGVRVPHRVVDGRVARLARPIHVDQPHAGLDQPACQQDDWPHLPGP